MTNTKRQRLEAHLYILYASKAAGHISEAGEALIAKIEKQLAA